MKKIILFAALGLLTLASCKKSSSPAITTAGTITATVDGVPYTCKLQTGSETQQDSSGTDLWYQYDAYAYDSAYNEFYIDAEQLNKAISNKLYGTQGDSTTYAYIEFDTNSAWWGSETILNPATITITSNGGGNVQGTFQGTVYLYRDSTSADKKVITNGKFNITAL
ncbi:MAG TPA: hypothetical protein VK559_09985 [Ferruginibacter sp.]|nr:hypothetical protein [Ferruginibacter sp.]